MPSTYTLISSNVLSSSAASVTFSSIPSTYTDLVLRSSARSSTATLNVRIRFNSDTATNYSLVYLYGEGSAGGSGIENNQTSLRPQATNASSYTADTFANFESYIPSYNSANSKPVSVFNVTENNVSGASSSWIFSGGGLWRNSSGITSIEITSSSGNFVSGSSFHLYGIKNS
jgi:hypothetical protein